MFPGISGAVVKTLKEGFGPLFVVLVFGNSCVAASSEAGVAGTKLRVSLHHLSTAQCPPPECETETAMDKKN